MALKRSVATTEGLPFIFIMQCPAHFRGWNVSWVDLCFGKNGERALYILGSIERQEDEVDDLPVNFS